MSDHRLDELLATLGPPAPPPVACPAHAALFRHDGELTTAELDALDHALDCADCIAALESHPVLDVDVLDLPLPPPPVSGVAQQLPHPKRGVRWRVGAAVLLAAAALVMLMPAQQPDTRPGPTHDGASGYAWVEPTTPGPSRDGVEQYPSANPVTCDTFRFSSVHAPPSTTDPFTGLHEG